MQEALQAGTPPSLHSLWGGGSFVRIAPFSSWGSPPYDRRPSPQSGMSGTPCFADNTNSCSFAGVFFFFFGGEREGPPTKKNSPHFRAGNSPDPATSPQLRGSVRLPIRLHPPPTPGPRKLQRPSHVCPERRGREGASETSECPRVPLSRYPKVGWIRSGFRAGGAEPPAANSPGRSGARGTRGLRCLDSRGSRQSFAGAQRAWLGGPAKGARARRGAARGAGVAARRHGTCGVHRARRASVPVRPPRRPRRSPRPVPPPARLRRGAARRAGARRAGERASERAARNCFHCKQKKATHDQAAGGGGGAAEGGGSGRERKRGPGPAAEARGAPPHPNRSVPARQLRAAPSSGGAPWLQERRPRGHPPGAAPRGPGLGFFWGVATRAAHFGVVGRGLALPPAVATCRPMPVPPPKAPKSKSPRMTMMHAGEAGQGEILLDPPTPNGAGGANRVPPNPARARPSAPISCAPQFSPSPGTKAPRAPAPGTAPAQPPPPPPPSRPSEEAERGAPSAGL